MKVEKLGDFWEKKVPKGDRHFMHGQGKLPPEVVERIFSRVKKHILDKIDFNDVDTTMDWGCGGGLFAKEISKHSHLCLMDISKSSLENALNYIDYNKNQVVYTKLLPDDIESFIYEGPKVDLIFSNEVIQHFPSLDYFKKVIKIWETIQPNIIAFQVKLDNEIKENINYQSYKENYLNGLRLEEEEVINYFQKINFQLSSKNYDKTKQGDTKLGYYIFKNNKNV